LQSSHGDTDRHKPEEHDQERQLAEGHKAERQDGEAERSRAPPMRQQQADAGRNQQPGSSSRKPTELLRC